MEIHILTLNKEGCFLEKIVRPHIKQDSLGENLVSLTKRTGRLDMSVFYLLVWDLFFSGQRGKAGR